jgi:uncharacterized protein with GYD domain
MPTYIGLYRFTEQGIQNVKDSPARIEAAKKAAQAMGIQIKGIYVVMGQYDLITIGEAPDDATIAKFALALGSQGNVSTQTLRAFTEDEFRKIVAALP